MNSKSNLRDQVSSFPFWRVLGRSLLWSLLLAMISGLICGVLGLYGHVDKIPFVGWVASSTKVVSISTTLAIITTLIAVRVAFDEAGVLLGFLILSFFGLGVVFAGIWFGSHAFQFFRGFVAGAMIAPAIVFVPAFFLVSREEKF